jgi:hypothetical protein
MKSRLFVFVMAFVLILSLVPVVGAQSGECYGLSDADCQLMLDAEANSANINAFNFNFDLDLSVDASAIGAMTGETDTAAKIAVKASGTGAFMMTDSADPMSSFALKMDLAGSANDGTGDQSFDFSFVIKDGMIYIMDPGSGQWMGMSMEDAMAMGNLPFDPSAMLSGGADPSALLGGMGGDMGLGDMNMSQFITQQRLGDESMMDQTMYPFQTTVDLAAMLNAPEVQQAITSALTMASGMSGAEGGGSEAAMIGMILPMILQNSSATIDVTEWIGADDMFIHKLGLDVNASIDLSVLLSMGGDSGMAMDPITVVLKFAVDLSDINGMVDITVPEGAMIVPMGS